MTEDAVLLTFADGVATLTLNRPESLNAASEAMMRSMERQLRALAEIEGLRVVILTGAGRAFCAGGDLIEFERALVAGGTALVDTLRFNQDVVQMIEDLPVPVIGAVNGVAVAGGLEMLLCCDIVIAAEGVRIGDGHARYGMLPAAGASVRLAERISPGRAAQMFYTAELEAAETLMDWGLVNEVMPRERLMARAMEIAGAIARSSPEAVAHIKALTGPRARAGSRAERFPAELEHFARHVGGRDLARGLDAFRRKRPIDYRDGP